jgi:hypothetical protein
MVKKADRLAKAAKRASLRQQYQREEAAMQSFMEECRTCMPPEDWERHFGEAKKYAGNTFHIVESLVFMLAASQMPIPPRLRKAIDAMLEALKINRQDSRWEDLRRLNYGRYWMTKYGYA